MAATAKLQQLRQQHPFHPQVLPPRVLPKLRGAHPTGVDDDQSPQVTVSFRSVTTVRNLTRMPWFRDAFWVTAVKEGREGGAGNSSIREPITVLNAGLWNLKYDLVDASDGYEVVASPATLVSELAALADALLASRSGGGDNSTDAAHALLRHRRPLYWRTITPVEPQAAGAAGKAPFPRGYDAALVARANDAAAAILAGAGAGVIDLRHRTAVMGDPADSSRFMTCDGTHHHAWLNVIMMVDTLMGVCALEKQVAASTSTNPHSTGSVASASSCTLVSLVHRSGPSDASDAPPPAVVSPARAAALLLLAAAAVAACAVTAWQHRGAVKQATSSVTGACGVIAGAVILVRVVHATGIVPSAGKDRAAGHDMLAAVSGVVLVAALLTVTRSRGQRAQAAVLPSTPAQHDETADAAPIVPRPRLASVCGTEDKACVPDDHDHTQAADATEQQQQQVEEEQLLPGGAVRRGFTSTGSPATLRLGACQGDGICDEVSPCSSEVVGGAGAMPVTPSAFPLVDLTPAATTVFIAAPTALAFDVPPSATAGAGRASSRSPPAALPSLTLMSLDVCNEAKGAAMAVFLLYHYWDVKSIYPAVRVLVAAFLALTGFGNTLSLSARPEAAAGRPPPLHKLALSVIRINLLVALLAPVVQAPYMLYYIAPLHTWATMVVYLLFAVAPSRNATAGGLASKLAVLTALHVVLFEVPGAFEAICRPLWPLLQFNGSMYEWTFRTRLDAYSSLFGMWAALARPAATRWLQHASGHRPARWAVGVTLIGVLLVHGWLLLGLPKVEYNTLHRWTCWVPLAAAECLRCLTPALSAHYSRALASLGTSSLELYLLQFHLWLSACSKLVLAPFPGARLLSFLAQSMLFIVVAWAVSRAQATLLAALAERPRASFGVVAALVCVLVGCTLLFSPSATASS